jgi:hypothetical protein
MHLYELHVHPGDIRVGHGAQAEKAFGLNYGGHLNISHRRTPKVQTSLL